MLLSSIVPNSYFLYHHRMASIHQHCLACRWRCLCSWLVSRQGNRSVQGHLRTQIDPCHSNQSSFEVSSALEAGSSHCVTCPQTSSPECLIWPELIYHPSRPLFPISSSLASCFSNQTYGLALLSITYNLHSWISRSQGSLCFLEPQHSSVCHLDLS